jgi:hypothetical protein
MTEMHAAEMLINASSKTPIAVPAHGASLCKTTGAAAPAAVAATETDSIAAADTDGFTAPPTDFCKSWRDRVLTRS